MKTRLSKKMAVELARLNDRARHKEQVFCEMLNPERQIEWIAGYGKRLGLAHGIDASVLRRLAIDQWLQLQPEL